MNSPNTTTVYWHKCYSNIIATAYEIIHTVVQVQIQMCIDYHGKHSYLIKVALCATEDKWYVKI